MKAKDIREFSPEEAAKKLRDLRNDLVNLRVKKHAGQLENPSELRTLRRDIARLETIILEKKSQSAA